MPKSQATVQIRPDSSTQGFVRVRTRHAVILPPVTKAHQVLMAAIAAEQPHEIIHFADKADIEERRDHLKAVMDAFVAYAEWIVSDTAENAPISYLDASVTCYLADAVSEVHGAFERAVDSMTDHHLEAAE